MQTTKLGFSGTYSAGKSTLINRIAKALSEVGQDYTIVRLSEIAVDCPFPLNQEQTFQTSLWFLSRLIQRELELSRDYPLILSDRTPLDIWALTECAADRDSIRDNLYSLAEILILRWLPTYRTIFFLRHDPDLPPNWSKIPRNDLRFRDRIEQLQEDYLQKGVIQYGIMPLDTELRFRAIMKTLEKSNLYPI